MNDQPQPQSLGQLIGSPGLLTPSAGPQKALWQMGEPTPEIKEKLRLRKQQLEREEAELRNPSPEKRFANIVGKAYASCRFDSFTINPHGSWTPDAVNKAKAIVGQLKAMAANIKEAVKKHRRQLILYGPPGVGKDHLAAAMMWSAFQAGLHPLWINGGKFEALVRDQMNFETQQPTAVWIRQWTAPDVLTLSDPDGERSKVSEDVRSKWYEVIDARIRNGTPTWITINGKCEADCSERLGSRVWDRLRQGAWLMHCDWPTGRNPRGTIE